MKREGWGFSSVPGFSTDARGTQIGIGHRRTLLDRKRKGKRPATGPWGREETHWEWVLNKLALLWLLRVILDPHHLYRAWANDLLYTKRQAAVVRVSPAASPAPVSNRGGSLTTGCG